MSFDTVTFWVFFAPAWIVWRFAPFGFAKTATLLLSLFFYGWWNPWFVSLITTSAVIDHIAGKRIHGSEQIRTRRFWLGFSLAANLGLLALFKYGPFAVRNFAAAARAAGFEVDWELHGWIVPVGISFYTFQTLSYTIDIYYRRLAPAPSFRDFFLYVSFFPQLMAGPIVRARYLLPQLLKRRRLRARTWQTGLYYIISGLFLKVVVADNLGPAVVAVFDKEALPNLSPAEVWLGVTFCSVQVFADFAGYSGIAIGLAYCLGLRFPQNFRYPYMSRSLSEIWTRWHMTLSTWFRDYVYIPLGGSRGSRGRFYFAVMATMLISGLWHGAAWTFVMWGFVQGLGVWIESWLGSGKSRAEVGTRPTGATDVGVRVMQMALTQVWWHITIVFFRAGDFEMAWQVLDRMIVGPFQAGLGLGEVENARFLLLVLPVFLLHVGQVLHEWYGLRKTAVRRALLAGLFLFLLTIVRRGETSEFVYFQF